MTDLREAAGGAALIAGLLLVGAVGWWLQLKPSHEVEAAAMRQLPMQLAGFRGTDIPLDDTVESMLMADFNLQRAYRTPNGETVWLYFGYYSTGRGGRPEHTPDQCYPSAGWQIERNDPFGSEGAAVNEMLVARAGERRLVHYWYRSHRSARLIGTWDTAWDRLVGRVREGRGDGALVRLSTTIDARGLDGARARLLAFGRAIEPELGSRWPMERPPG